MLRLLAQREEGYEDMAAVIGISVEEVREARGDRHTRRESPGAGQGGADRGRPARGARPPANLAAPTTSNSTRAATAEGRGDATILTTGDGRDDAPPPTTRGGRGGGRAPTTDSSTRRSRRQAAVTGPQHPPSQGPWRPNRAWRRCPRSRRPRNRPRAQRRRKRLGLEHHVGTGDLRRKHQHQYLELRP